MTTPCDKGPALERIEKKFDRIDTKIDKIGEQLVSAAVLAEAHRHLSEKVDGIDARVQVVESAPRKIVMAAIFSSISAVGAAVAAVATFVITRSGP